MRRATLTILRDEQRRLHRLRVGDVVDLSLVDANVVDGADDSFVEFHRTGRRAFRFAPQGDVWHAHAFPYDGVFVDGDQIENASRPLDSGDEILVDHAVFRFDVVADPSPLARLVAVEADPGEPDCGALVLWDLAGLRSAVRAFGLSRAGPVHVVARPSPTSSQPLVEVHDDVPRGVPLLEVAHVAGAVDVDVAIDAVARLADQLIRVESHEDGGFQQRLPWLAWDGELVVLPPLRGRRDDDRLGALQWWLRALCGRSDAATIAPLNALRSLRQLHRDLHRERAARRRVDPHELVAIAKGLLPDEWRREQELADELAIVEAAGFDAFLARARRRRS